MKQNLQIGNLAGKFIVTACILAAFGMPAFAQKDVKVRLAGPKENQEITRDKQFDLSFTVTNKGAKVIAKTDTMALGVKIAGNYVFQGVLSLNGKDFMPGDSLVYKVPMSLKDFTKDASNVDFCVGVIIFSNTDPTPNDQSDCNKVNLKVGATSVNTVVSDDAIKVYPNPATDILKINTPFAGNFIIYDLTGKAIARHTLSATENTISVSGLAAGTYMYLYTNQEGTAQKGKIVINK